jgi:glycosyltransferase involved in cell wall biosynthesis
MWKPVSQYSAAQNHESSKNSDWLFHAFAGLLAARPGCRARLFVVEYGPDIAATKALVAELGIDDRVSWLPKMARKDLMWLLGRVSLGVGEFMNPRRMIWGGTGWETLAAGKPLLQGFRFEEGEFENLYGYPPPPLIPIRAQADVLNGLLFAADHPEEAAKMGERARDWFDTHNGISLAKKWLELVTGA